MSRSTNDIHQLIASAAASGPETVDSSFAQFKLRLSVASERWKASRVQKSRSIVQVSRYLAFYVACYKLLLCVGYTVIWRQDNYRRAYLCTRSSRSCQQNPSR